MAQKSRSTRSGKMSQKQKLQESKFQKSVSTVHSLHLPTIIQRGKLDVDSLSPQEIGELQRTIGNRAVDGLLGKTNNRRPGNTLSGHVQKTMEQVFQADFSNIRVHEGSEADKVDAAAFTQGNNIHFSSGKYNPSTHQGKKLLGHELAHVVQQRAGRVSTGKTNGAPINDDVRLETEAEKMGEQAAQTMTSVHRPLDPTPRPAAVNNAQTNHSTGPAVNAQALPIQRYKTDGAKNSNAYTRGNAESEDDFRKRMAAEMASMRKAMENKQDPQALKKGELGSVPAKFQASVRNEREDELAKLRKEKNVTQGATKGSTAFQGGNGKKAPTLSGGKAGALEHALENPTSTKARPRVGMSTRQAQVMDVAKKADPFMRTLASGGDLSQTHEQTKAHTGKKGKLKGGYAVSGTTVQHPTGGGDLYAFGAQEYGNRPSHEPKNHLGPASDYAERLLPELTNHPGGTDAQGEKSRTGRWSEADVDPRQAVGGKLQGRNAARLLHTSANSKAMYPNASGGTEERPVEHRFHVSADHYESAIPVSPVETDYAKNHPYTPKYADPSGKKNSLQHQDDTLREQAAKAAQTASKQREGTEAAKTRLEEISNLMRHGTPTGNELEDSLYGNSGL